MNSIIALMIFGMCFIVSLCVETGIDSMARAFHCLTSSIKDIDWIEVEGDSDGTG